MKFFRYSELALIPWKNGAGFRRDIASGEIHEPSASTVPQATWMIGLADLNQDAPFSSYPGVSRWFMPLGQGRLTLLFKVAAGTHSVALDGKSDAHFFSGDDELTMMLHDGPMKALNVMTTGRPPKVSMVRIGYQPVAHRFMSNDGESGDLNLLLVAKGRCRVTAGVETHTLVNFDSFSYLAKEPISIEPDGDNSCELIRVCLRY